MEKNKLQKIINVLHSAKYLIESELEFVDNKLLQQQYLEVITEINQLLTELET